MVTSQDDDVFARVLGRYPLEGLHVVEAFEAAGRNDNFLVRDETGKRFVLRHYRRSVPEARAQFQVRFQRWLHDRGYPTPQIIDSNDGPLVVEDGDPWSLFAFAEGHEYDFSDLQQTAEAGRQLAHLHMVTDYYQADDVPIAHNPSIRRWWTEGEREVGALAELFASEGVEEEIAFLRDWQASLADTLSLEQLDALPSGWLHGDFHGRNVVFDGDKQLSLIEFDVVCRGARVEDVGLALFMFGRSDRGAADVRPGAGRAFLDGYDSVRTLSPAEREALPLMTVIAWAPSVAYHEMLLREGEDSVAYFRRFVYLMRALGPEMERFTIVLAEDLLEAQATKLDAPPSARGSAVEHKSPVGRDLAGDGPRSATASTNDTAPKTEGQDRSDGEKRATAWPFPPSAQD